MTIPRLCANCAYLTEELPGNHLCFRYPRPELVEPWHWCGEWVAIEKVRRRR